MNKEPKTIEDFEEQAKEFFKRMSWLNQSVSYALLRPLARELLDAYQQGIQDNITGRA